MFKKEKPVIEFVSSVPGITGIKEICPQPYKNFIPKWWKDTPAFYNDSATVKVCPSFPDFFSQGFVMPMWCDIKILYDKNTDLWKYEYANNFFPPVEIHPNNQFLSHVDAKTLGKSGNFVFKLNSPWQVITRPGWSVMQLPLFYHFNYDWTVLPGIIDTDIHYQVNQQVLYFGNGEEVIIKSGDPLVVYIPYERKKYKHIVRDITEKDKILFHKEWLNLSRFFTGSGEYRRMQKNRDKLN